MAAERKLETVTIRADSGVLVFTRNGDGAEARINYSTSSGVSDEDMVMAYSELEAMQIIVDANDTEVERYRDASLEELNRDAE